MKPHLPFSSLFVVFVVGAAIMVFEILMSRVISPYFGNTVYTWGNLIGVILGAMTLGYWIGGKLAPTRAEGPLPSLFLIVSGILVILLPFTAYDLSLSAQRLPLPPPFIVLMVITLLCFIPACLMTTLFPFEAHRMSSHYSHVGNLAGHLGIASTVGSLVGTFMATFVLVTIEGLGTRRSLLGTGLVLILCGIWVAYQSQSLRKKGQLAGIAFLALVGLGGLLKGWSAHLPPLREAETLLEERESSYHFMRVTEVQAYPEHSQTLSTARVIHFSDPFADQSGVWRDLPGKPSTTGYSDLFFLAFAFLEKFDRMAILGAGGGTIPRRVLHNFPAETHPNLQVDVIDIDPAIFELAEKYFEYPRQDRRLTSHIKDARMFIRSGKEKYDLIFWDLYTNGGQVPEHLVTREYFSEIKERLRDDGVLMINFFLGHPPSMKDPTSPKFLSLVRTLGEVFDLDRFYAFSRQKFNSTWFTYPILNRGGVHIIVVKGQGRLTPKFDELAKRVPRFTSQTGLTLSTLSSSLVTPLFPETERPRYAAAPVLTDDYNPISYFRY